MKESRFEDLECWQETRKLVNTVYNLSKKRKFSRDLPLTRQITGSAISALHHITEGWTSQSGQDFARALMQSKKSCGEVQNCLYIAQDQGYINKQEFRSCFNQSEAAVKSTDSHLHYLRSHGFRPTPLPRTADSASGSASQRSGGSPSGPAPPRSGRSQSGRAKRSRRSKRSKSSARPPRPDSPEAEKTSPASGQSEQ